jgi:beta-glucosidase-like glycosyl hydrolase
VRFVHFACLLAACSAASDEYTPSGPPDDAGDTDDGGKSDSPSPGPDVPLALQSKDIGQFFMVDHFGVTEAGFADVRNKIKTKNLGAIILWNPTGASGETLRSMISGYSQLTQAAGRDELFYAVDHEELHTQRFTAANGFTTLVQGSTLGAAAMRDRLCELHAQITSRELASVGMNMALGTVSDIYTADSGTRGMFRTRAISSDPANVAPCITAMTQAYAQEGHVIYITKHFPGLGNASGNTDVDGSVQTRSTTTAAIERELAPYRAAAQSVNAANGWAYFGTMISHASYPILDASALPATLSRTIVNDFLHGPAPGIDFHGITVSDAFWTWGATKGLAPIERQRLMARSFLAGVDILMIAKTDFTGAWGYFQEVYADMLPAAEQQALVAATGFASWDDLRAAFRARVDESAARIHMVKSTLGLATSNMKTGPATDATTDLVPEYRSLSN